MRRIALFAVVGAVLMVACGGDGGGITVTNARVGQPTGPNAAFYFTASSDGEADRLVGASTEAAASVELHETTTGDGGTLGMTPIEGVDLPADGSLVLEPGGYHVMLIDADRLEVGDTVEVTITWENAGEMVLEADVVEPSDTMSHDDMDMGDEGSDG